jgi:cobalamin biosynthesis Co2+ chelatase CbiK
VIQKKGIKVMPITRGIGENGHIADIYVNHIRDVARDNDIDL